jgi:hypothetical protein
MKKFFGTVFLAAMVSGPTLVFAGQSSEASKPFPTPFGQCEKPLKSSHIIFNCFGDWSVRKVFERESKEHRYTDMKSNMRMSNGLDFTFQISRSSPTGWTVLLGAGAWIDRVELEIDGKVKIVKPSITTAKFWGYAEMDFYQAFAKAKSDIKIQVYTNNKVYRGRISHKGAAEALEYLGLKVSP